MKIHRYRDKEGGWTFLHWAVGMMEGERENEDIFQVQRTTGLLCALFKHQKLKGPREAQRLILARDDFSRTAVDIIFLSQNEPMAPVVRLLLELLPREEVTKFLTDPLKKPITGGDNQVIGDQNAPTRLQFLVNTHTCTGNKCGKTNDCCLFRVAQTLLHPSARANA